MFFQRDADEDEQTRMMAFFAALWPTRYTGRQGFALSTPVALAAVLRRAVDNPWLLGCARGGPRKTEAYRLFCHDAQIAQDSYRQEHTWHTPVPYTATAHLYAWWPQRIPPTQVKLAAAPLTADAKLTVYTDGAGTGGRKATATTRAGWGVVAFRGTHLHTELSGRVVTDENHPHSIGAKIGSNNTGELSGIYWGLHWCYHHRQANWTSIDIRSDSLYAMNVAQRKWETPKNPHIAAHLHHILYQLRRNGISVTFTHVRGHTGEIWNERADRLAAAGARI